VSLSYNTVDRVVAHVLATAPLPHDAGHSERLEESGRRHEALRTALQARQEGQCVAR
jgi:hypothetical protein